MKKIFVIGGSNIDIYAKSKYDLVLKDSNIGSVRYAFGGVARNIVENLANLEADVIFTTVVGNDLFGNGIYNSLVQKGVNMSNSLIIDGANTSSYIAILDQNDMYVAMCDTKVLDENLTYATIDNLKDKISEGDYVVMDTNLSKDLLEYSVKNLKGIKVVDAISANKVPKIFDVLSYIDVLKMNKLEAEKVSGISITSNEDIKHIVSNLNKVGIDEVLVTSGTKLFVGMGGRVYSYHHHDYQEYPVNVTGAGDSLLANYVYMRANDEDVDNASAFGLSAAVLTVNDINAVAPLNKNIIKDNIQNLKIDKEVF